MTSEKLKTLIGGMEIHVAKAVAAGTDKSYSRQEILLAEIAYQLAVMNERAAGGSRAFDHVQADSPSEWAP